MFSSENSLRVARGVTAEQNTDLTHTSGFYNQYIVVSSKKPLLRGAIETYRHNLDCDGLKMMRSKQCHAYEGQ